jgi:hypothetical protein
MTIQSDDYHASRDDVYLLLPGAEPLHLPGVVPRRELDRVLLALRRERDAHDETRAQLRRARMDADNLRRLGTGLDE